MGESGREVWGCIGGDLEGVSGREEVFDFCGTGIINGGKDDVIVGARRRAVGAGVEEREEDLGHLFEALVAEAAEEEGAGLRLG
jgi:hypothetical protein